MCIEIQKKGKLLIATLLEKRLDAALAPQFKDKMAELIEAGHQIILLDLSKTHFVDSSGLGVLVSSLKKLGNQGDLVLCGVEGAVATLFQLTRMDKVFALYPDVATAEAHYNEP